MDEALQSQARHLYSVEKLSICQVAHKLGVSRKKAARLISTDNLTRKVPDSIIKPYEGLIHEWYRQYPFLQAIHIHERLKGYGFTGGYTSVKEYTMPFRKKRRKAYFELHFLPGQESQIDWMQRTLPFGVVYGFVYILAFSRYLYVRFYHRNSMEFFLDGHIEAFRETGGVTGTNRYDNLKSVVISRKPLPFPSGGHAVGRRGDALCRSLRGQCAGERMGRANALKLLFICYRSLNVFLSLSSTTDSGELTLSVEFIHKCDFKAYREFLIENLLCDK